MLERHKSQKSANSQEYLVGSREIRTRFERFFNFNCVVRNVEPKILRKPHPRNPRVLLPGRQNGAGSQEEAIGY